MGYLPQLRSLKQPRLISYSYDMSITVCLGDFGPHHPHWGSLRETSSLCFCPYQMQEERNRADFTLTPKLPFQRQCASVQCSSVAQSCLTLCDPMNHSTSGLPVHHQLPEVTQTHVHRVSDAIQPSHPLSSPSPPASNPSQDQSLFQWVNSSHEVAKVLEFQLEHQSFQRNPRADLL